MYVLYTSLHLGQRQLRSFRATKIFLQESSDEQPINTYSEEMWVVVDLVKLILQEEEEELYAEIKFYCYWENAAIFK